MASPAVGGVTEGALSSAGTSVAVTLPAGGSASDEYIVIIAKGSVACTINALTDWTELFDENVAAGLAIIRYTGAGVPSNPTFVQSTSSKSAWGAYRITGADKAIAPQVGTVATAASTTPDPPSVTVTGGPKDVLAIACFSRAGEEADDDTWITSNPSGYTLGLIQKATGTVGTNLAGILGAAAAQVAATSTVNPGTFTIATGTWRAQTIVVHPVVPTTTAVGEVSLAPSSAPAVDTGHTLKVRARKASGTGTVTLSMALYEGANNRSGNLTTSALTTSLAEYSLAIPEASAANITSYSNLGVRFWADSSTGDAVNVEIAEIWLLIPTPSGTSVTLNIVTQPNAAQALTKTKTIIKTIGFATNLNTAQPLVYVKPIRKTLGIVTTGATSAQPLTFIKPIRKTLGIATNLNTAQPVTYILIHYRTITVGTTPSAAQPVTFTKTIRVTIGVASTLNTAQPVTFTKPIRKTLGVATTLDSAQATKRPKLGVAVELDIPQPAGRHQGISIQPATQFNTARSLAAPQFKSLTPAFTANVAQAVTFTKPIVKSLGLATSVNAAQALTFTKTIRKTLGIASQPNIAQALPHIKTKTLGLATQPNTAQAVTYTLIHFRTIGVATQPNTAQTLAHIKTKILGLATNLNSAQALRRPKLGVATELDIAQPAGESQAVTLGVASTANASRPLTFTKTIQKTIGLVTQPNTALTQHLFVRLGIATVTTLATAIAFTKSIAKNIAAASEADTARPASITHVHFRSIGVATTANAAQTVLFGNFKAINNATETNSAHTLRVPKLSAAVELDVPQPAGQHQAVSLNALVQPNTARPLTATKTIFKSLGAATTANVAQPVTEWKIVSIGVVTQPNSARPLTVTKTIQKTIGAATQPNIAQTLIVTLVHFRTIGIATTTNSARPLSTGLALVPAQETDTARTLSVINPIHRTLGIASTLNTALTPQITHAQNITIGPASSFESAHTDVNQIDKTVTITLPRQIVYF